MCKGSTLLSLVSEYLAFMFHQTELNLKKMGKKGLLIPLLN